MGFGILTLLLYLIVLVGCGENFNAYIVSRGVCSNFLMGYLVFYAADKLCFLRRKRHFCLGAFFGLLSLVHSHIMINGSYPLVSHAELALNRVFLVSVILDSKIVCLFFLYFCIGAIYSFYQVKFESLVSRFIVNSLVMISVFTSVLFSMNKTVDVFRWEATNFFDYNLLYAVSRYLGSEGEGHSEVLDGRRLLLKESGSRLYSSSGSNVIVVMVEGLSRHFVTAGYTPEIELMTKEGMECPFFINHQRQTNRGLYSTLCGAYPNLKYSASKSDLMALGGLYQECLPLRLKENGYKTLFLQAADLGYMSKDLFSEAAGFSEYYGKEAVVRPHVSGPWGVDDLSLYNEALSYIEKINSEPYFMTLLTSGTHPPYATPYSKNDKKKAFEYASSSLYWFYNKLKKKGLLNNTIIIITSDESSANSLKTEDPLDQNRGFLLVLGNEILPRVNSTRFGQVDLAFSILDYVCVDSNGFGGRSIFQEYGNERVLYAGNSFNSRRFIVGPKNLIQVNLKSDPVRYVDYFETDKEGRYDELKVELISNENPSVMSFFSMLEFNDLNTESLAKYAVDLPEKLYSGDSVYYLLGRYISTVPLGSSFEVEVNIDNDIKTNQFGDVVFHWLAYDCMGEEQKTLSQKVVIPYGESNYSIRLTVPQIYGKLCHKAWVYSEAPGQKVDFKLKKLRIVNIKNLVQ